MTPKINETNCEFMGHMARGAYVDGKYATVYICMRQDGTYYATTWSGVVLAEEVSVVSEWCRYSKHGTPIRMMAVRFTIDGVTYAGRLGADWSRLVRAKAIK